MTVENTLRRSLLTYPTIFVNALTVYDHLFCTNGNGYEWEDGELVEIYKSGYDNIEDAVKGLLHKNLIDEFNGFDSLSRLLIRDAENIGIPVLKVKNKRICEYVDMIYDIDNRMKDFSIPDDEEIKKRVKDYRWSLYPICKYAQICNIPDDVKPDWLEACDRMMKFIDEHPDLVRDEDNLLPEVRKRIEELKSKVQSE